MASRRELYKVNSLRRLEAWSHESIMMPRTLAERAPIIGTRAPFPQFGFFVLGLRL